MKTTSDTTGTTFALPPEKLIKHLSEFSFGIEELNAMDKDIETYPNYLNNVLVGLAKLNDPSVTDLIAQILNLGANINGPNDQGETLLTLAVKRQNIAVVKAALNLGADVAIANNEGKKALDLAGDNQDIHNLLSPKKVEGKRVEEEEALFVAPPPRKLSVVNAELSILDRCIERCNEYLAILYSKEKHYDFEDINQITKNDFLSVKISDAQDPLLNNLSLYFLDIDSDAYQWFENPQKPQLSSALKLGIINAIEEEKGNALIEALNKFLENCRLEIKNKMVNAETASLLGVNISEIAALENQYLTELTLSENTQEQRKSTQEEELVITKPAIEKENQEISLARGIIRKAITTLNISELSMALAQQNFSTFSVIELKRNPKSSKVEDLSKNREDGLDQLFADKGILDAIEKKAAGILRTIETPSAKSAAARLLDRITERDTKPKVSPDIAPVAPEAIDAIENLGKLLAKRIMAENKLQLESAPHELIRKNSAERLINQSQDHGSPSVTG